MDGTDTKDLMKHFDDAANKAAEQRSVHIDVEKYQHMLDGSGMNEAQKREVLEALWSMIVTFVDLGFGVHPVQQACGQLKKELDQGGKAESDQVNCDKPELKNSFNDAPEQ